MHAPSRRGPSVRPNSLQVLKEEIKIDVFVDVDENFRGVRVLRLFG
jgi:hypothetical protein